MAYVRVEHGFRAEDQEFSLPPIELRSLHWAKGGSRQRPTSIALKEFKVCKLCGVEPITWIKVGERSVPVNSYGQYHDCRSVPARRRK